MKPAVYIMLFMLMFFLGCQQSETFRFPGYQPQIVVDGWIENKEHPRVLLTWSSGYTGEVDSVDLPKLVLMSAKVRVYNDSVSEILTLKPNDAYFPPYMYVGSSVKGEVGQSYHLEVVYRGDTLTASTYIPEPVYLDSAWLQMLPGDTSAYVGIALSDDAGSKDYYRFLTKRGERDTRYVPTYISLFDDKHFNGQQLSLHLYKGNISSTGKEDILYYTTDEQIFLKAVHLTKAGFDFWESVDNEILNAGNPFAATNRTIKSNVNGGLGIWDGVASVSYLVWQQKSGPE